MADTAPSHETPGGDAHSAAITAAARVLCPNGLTTGPCQACIDAMTLHTRRNTDDNPYQGYHDRPIL